MNGRGSRRGRRLSRAGAIAVVLAGAMSLTSCLPLPGRSRDTGCARVASAGDAPSVAASPDRDRVWLGDGDVISRLDPLGGAIVQIVPTGGEIVALEARGDVAAVIVADGRLLSTTVDATEAVPIPVPFTPSVIAFAPDGALWVAAGTAPSDVARIDPATRAVTARFVVERRVTDMVVDAQRLWAISAGTTDEGSFLTGVDATTGTTVASVPLPDQPVGLALDDAAVWVSFQRSARDQLLRYDPETAARGAGLSLCTDSQVLAAGGAVLWSSGLDSPWVMRIDPAGVDVSATTKLATKTRAGAATPAGFWVRDPDRAVWFVDADTMRTRRYDLPASTSAAGRRGTQAAAFAASAPPP